MSTNLKIVCLALLATSGAAWTTTAAPRFARTSTTTLFARPDSSAAVAAALEASKKYGATSPEARVAWEAVEDMDAADNRYVVAYLLCRVFCCDYCVMRQVRSEP